jgi:hypothetical protein
MVVIDGPTGQQIKGVSGVIQHSEGLVEAMPDLRRTSLEHKVIGHKVTTCVPEAGRQVVNEYQLKREFNDEGKLVRLAVNSLSLLQGIFFMQAEVTGDFSGPAPPRQFP